MRNKKGLRVLIPCMLVIILIMTGCAQEEAPGGVTDVTGAFALPEGETAESAQTTGEASSEEATPATVTVSEISSASENEGNPPKARTLSAEECGELQKFFNEVGNYGFLLSIYEKPQDLDADQVFFAGAGLELRVPADEEREAYLEETGEDEAPNLFRLGATQVNDYLQYRAGVSMKDLSRQPDWVYLEDYDAYYLCHGDERRREISTECITESKEERRTWTAGTFPYTRRFSRRTATATDSAQTACGWRTDSCSGLTASLRRRAWAR